MKTLAKPATKPTVKKETKKMEPAPVQAKPTVTIEPPKAKAIKRLPTVDNLEDNWLLRRFINKQLAKDDRDLKAILISGANYAEVEKLYIANGGTEERIVAAMKLFMDFYGKK